MLLVPYLGWSNAITAALWWLLPDSALVPVIGVAINLFAVVWIYVDDFYSYLSTSDFWYVPVLGLGAVAVNAFAVLTALGGSSGYDNIEDYGEEEEDDAAAGDCDPYYDYYCY